MPPPTITHDIPDGPVDSSQIEAAMGDPDEFPDDKAAELREKAEWLDFACAALVAPPQGLSWTATVDLIISRIGDILGDHRVARDLAIKWGTCPTIIDVTSSLVSAKAELVSYWQGGAKEGFDEYFDSVKDALATAQSKFEELSATLVNAIRYIYGIYGDAIKFLIGAAATAVAWKPHETATAISDLANHIGDLMSSAISAEGEFAADATTLTTLPEQFTAPAELPTSVDDWDKWGVLPKPD